MGCTPSKIDSVESLARCRQRKQLMKDAVSSRNSFAAAHSAYAASLKNAGAALSDFGDGEIPDPQPSSSAAAAAPSSSAAVEPHIDTLPPPPPPLPDLNPPPLQRAASMPDLPIPNPIKEKNPPAIKEDEDDDEDDAEEVTESKGVEDTLKNFFFGLHDDLPPSQPQMDEGVAVEPPSTTPVMVVETKPTPETSSSNSNQGGKMVAAAGRSVVSLLNVLKELDEHFLRGYESARDVSKMLEAEAARMHYHSNFADNRGHIDHSARVMRVITWNKSLKGTPNVNGGKDDYDSAEWETSAIMLDKMLAWEKKLYDELKAGELMKIEYQRKVALLSKQRKRGVNPEILRQTKSAVSYLHTRYIVDMQSMDSTISEIKHLRDHRLYTKLVELVDGMARMWETIYRHHSSQLKISTGLRALDSSLAPKETSRHHHERTTQLWEVLREWQSHFQKLMINQKAYIRTLNSWLKLNLIPVDISLKEKASSSPPRTDRPPIQVLLHAWHDQLEKLPDGLASGAIYSFSEVVHTIMIHQEDEMRQKERCEEARREYSRKSRVFDDWYQKHAYRGTTSTVEEAVESSEGGIQVDPVAEKKFAVEAAKVKHEAEVEAHRKLCKQVREKSLGSLRTHLPELFRALSDFSLVCSEMYKDLLSIARPQDPKDN